MNNKFHRFVVDELKKTGLPYSIELGARHRKVFLDGKLLTVIPHGRSDNQGDHILKLIKRATT